MDLPYLPVDGLDAIAARLDRCAERVSVQAVAIRAGTSETWQGGAADRHRELVAGHAADLDDLADRLRDAASAVRHLRSTARARLVDLGRVDRTVGVLP